MDRRRLCPRDAHILLHLRLNVALQLLLDSGKFGPQLLRKFDGKERPDHFKPALFMTVWRDRLRRLRRCLSRCFGRGQSHGFSAWGQSRCFREEGQAPPQTAEPVPNAWSYRATTGEEDPTQLVMTVV